MPAPKVDPKSLGIVQIMIGVVIFMFGFPSKYLDGAVSVYSGVMHWGSLCFLISGALSAATVDQYPNLEKSALGLNLVSAVAAFVAVVMYCVDLARMSTSLSENAFRKNMLDPTTVIPLSTFRILLVLSILEVCMSIWTLVLIWKTKGSTEATAEAEDCPITNP